jgi:hypothetical protein
MKISPLSLQLRLSYHLPHLPIEQPLEKLERPLRYKKVGKKNPNRFEPVRPELMERALVGELQRRGIAVP